MLKIRDLGINVIPATMRPPEIGNGGAFDMQMCGCSPVQSKECVPQPSGCPAPSRPCAATPQCPAPSAKYDVGGLPHDAVVQLRQQVQDRIGAEFQN